ncbi:MAG: DUF485 domain-containing protein [Alphaproteobacteria bacterium]|nr:DUF485 domain-containing protein [Alphaproteobacteria bacterium]
MSKLTFSEIGQLPEYKDLLSRRRKIFWPLMLVTLFSYYAFILMVAYAPEKLHESLWGTEATLGILMGLGVIFLTLLVTFAYVWYANRHIEDLVHNIQEKVAGDE